MCANNCHDSGNASTCWKVGNASVLVFDSRAAMGNAAADAIAQRIRAVAHDKGNVRIIFAAAPSQSDVLEALIRLDDIPWEQVSAFHMDDYVGLPASAPQRFANWLTSHFFSKVPLGEVHRIADTGNADDICHQYSQLLAKAPIDIVCLGIGVNGHIAFNDPPVADFNDPVSVKTVRLDQICRQQQVDDKCFASIDQVPAQAITLTVPTLMAAASLFCVVPGAHKRAAVKAALEGPVVTDCPASILKTHSDCTVFLDPEANPNG